MNLVYGELKESAHVLEQFMNDQKKLESIVSAASLLVSSFKKGGKVIACGNGGSCCDAVHFAEELTGRYRENRIAFPAIAVSDPGHITCVSNDYGYADVFSRFIEGLGKSGDVLLGITTSGCSENIIKAVNAAHCKKMSVVLLTGKEGGKLAGVADVEIRIPHFEYADRIQEMHIKVIHILIFLIEIMYDMD